MVSSSPSNSIFVEPHTEDLPYRRDRTLMSVIYLLNDSDLWLISSRVDPPIITTTDYFYAIYSLNRCQPENYEPPLSTLAEGKSFPLIRPVCLTSMGSTRAEKQIYGRRCLYGPSANERILYR